jgi:glutathione-regulated potassium-efflux system ancillary protein KefG
MPASESSSRVLVLFAHPALERSRVNRVLVRALRDLDSVTVHDLYEAYPEFDVDVPREQELLASHDAVVLQHPFYWYSTPALLKQWEDLVLQHGWAYGSGGTALHNKTLVSAITAGGTRQTYARDGHNRFTIRELLAPIEQTARLCGMRYLEPFVVYGTHRLTDAELASRADRYRRFVTALRDDEIEHDRVVVLDED